jgi:hypothetical protein
MTLLEGEQQRIQTYLAEPRAELPGHEGGQMANNHQGGKNPPGYTCPKRRGKRTVQTYLEPPLYAAMQAIAARRKIRLGDAFHLACREFAKRNSNEFVDAPASYDPAPPPRIIINKTAELLRLARAAILPPPPSPEKDFAAGKDPGDVPTYGQAPAPRHPPGSDQPNRTRQATGAEPS